MKLVIRSGPDDFYAFKIGEACLKVGGVIVSVTMNPQMIFDHVQGHQKPVQNGPLIWTVWMTFPDAFDVDALDDAIERENTNV